jgi:hypothetical protein
METGCVNIFMQRLLPTIPALISLGAFVGQAEARGQQGYPPPAADGSVLPFALTPTASVAEPTSQQSTMKWRTERERLRPGAANVLIVLVDAKLAAASFADNRNTDRILETSINNLAQDEAPALFHFGAAQSQPVLLVRLKQPDGTAPTQ